MQAIQITAVIVLLSLGAPVLSLLSLPTADSGLVLVLSPPWADRSAEIRRSGARAIGPSDTPFATLVQADAPGFGPRLRAAGPFLVLDGRALASLCGVSG